MGKSTSDIKIIFIAGNEPFTQGPKNYETACGNAREKDVIINTIFCGNFEEGINGKWKSGANIGGGDYMSIEHNKRTVYIETPFDDQINDLSQELNDTYIYYGSKGKEKKQEQLNQDANAASYSKSNLASRNSIKVSKFYRNTSWDLVDAYEDEKVEIQEIDKSSLPSHLKNKSDDELEQYVNIQLDKRNKIKAQIDDLNKKRGAYIATQSKDQAKSLEASMIKALKKQALSKNFSW